MKLRHVIKNYGKYVRKDVRRREKKFGRHLKELMEAYEDVKMDFRASRSEKSKEVTQSSEMKQLRLDITEIKRAVQELKNVSSSEQPSWAQVASGGPKPISLPKQVERTTDHVVIPRNKDNINPETMKKQVEKLLEPVKNNIMIKRVKKNRANDLVIETTSRVEAEKILNNKKLANVMEVAAPKKFLPKVIIYDALRTEKKRKWKTKSGK